MMYWKGMRRPLAEHHLVIMCTDKSTAWVNVPLYLEEVNHSPTGFEWGYGGSGPHQLAYAILRTYLEIFDQRHPSDAKRLALHYYGKFAWDIVCNKFGRSDEWILNSDEVTAWLDKERIANVGGVPIDDVN